MDRLSYPAVRRRGLTPGRGRGRLHDEDIVCAVLRRLAYIVYVHKSPACTHIYMHVDVTVGRRRWRLAPPAGAAVPADGNGGAARPRPVPRRVGGCGCALPWLWGVAVFT